MAFTRRQLIAVGGAGAAIALTYTFYPRAAMSREFVMSVVRRNLPYLDIQPTMLAQFADDFVKYQTLPDPSSLVLGATLTPIFVSRSEWYSDRFRRFERRVVSRFLLSTDFFQNGRRTDRTLNYLGLADPYEMPCSNVIARVA